MIDDDDDGFMFDGPDEAELAVERPILVVPARPPRPDIINDLEARYRREGSPPIMFVDCDDDTGDEIFGNPLTFARAMELPAGVLPTMAEADEWVARESAAGRWAEWTW